MTPENAYEWLREQSVKTAHICAVAQLAAWDQRTFIPPLGHESRSKQLEALTDIIHSRQIEPKIAECIDIVENSNFFNDSDSQVRVNVKAWKREYSKNVKIPISLACELTRAQSLGESAWESARPANDWKGFSVFLKRLIELNKEKAEALGYKVEPYDALIDDFEPGALTSQIEAIFSDLKEPLVNLYKK
jgi:carboxypeptidase Taq